MKRWGGHLARRWPIGQFQQIFGLRPNVGLEARPTQRSDAIALAELTSHEKDGWALVRSA